MRNQAFLFSVSNILQFMFRNDFLHNSLHMQNIFRTAPNLIDTLIFFISIALIRTYRNYA